jgi:hypothetical protein
MVLYEVYSYKDADKILESKGLLKEIKTIVGTTLFVKHGAIQTMFQKSDWGLEHYIFKDVLWRWDAFKDNIAVSIELSLCDSVHRDFLRATLAHKQGRLDALVYVVSTASEPKFANVKRDIEIFKDLMDFPILLIGLEPQKKKTSYGKT